MLRGVVFLYKLAKLFYNRRNFFKILCVLGIIIARYFGINGSRAREELGIKEIAKLTEDIVKLLPILTVSRLEVVFLKCLKINIGIKER